MQLPIYRKRVTRSPGGDLAALIMLLLLGSFTALPMVYVVSSAFKPLNELFLFPPRFFVRNPTLDNFKDLAVLMSESWVPISRYLLNTLIITCLGTAGHVLFASLCAFALAKHRFPGSRLVFNLIVISLMFAPEVTAIPNYLIIARLGWLNTYRAVIVPAWQSSLGLFLMKQFMDQMVPDSLLEAARIDGAGEWKVFWKVAMPTVRPAWLTLIILSFQSLWGNTGSSFIYSENLKTLPYALNQIVAGGIARAGVGAAVALLMMIVPVTVFIFNQRSVVQTMGTSGLKE
ncbi:MAG TPA: carbohydrate ABC transporter permease [Firmicutes bacterium]|jgi:ABC-type glycerol-3-phosphate transport system permease component|nr:carbohydrate ABC transporter permease [Bacillota bacterium]